MQINSVHYDLDLIQGDRPFSPLQMSVDSYDAILDRKGTQLSIMLILHLREHLVVKIRYEE